MELNKKLAEWAGLEWLWPHNPECKCGAIDNDDSMRSWYIKQDNDYHLATEFYHDDINFTEDLTACFKWLVPDLDISSIQFIYLEDDVLCRILTVVRGDEFEGIAPMGQEALALCLAIEKLIEAQDEQ